MKADIINGAALISTLGLAMLGATRVDVLLTTSTQVENQRSTEAVQTPTEIIDARGLMVPIEDYQRVASLNTVADHLLLQLISPNRLVGVTRYNHDEHPESWRFENHQALPSSQDIENVLSVSPDLVISSIFASESNMSRLREAGIQVFDLGDMRGIETTLTSIENLGILLNVPEQAERLAQNFMRQVEALRARVPVEERVPGLYLTVMGDAWFGGTTGSSFADVLELAGVIDIAAEHGFQDWPQYNAEELLTMAPNLIVTNEDSAEIICSNSMLGMLPACGPTGRIIEVPNAYQSDPGLGLIEAAASTQALIHPSRQP